MMIEPESTLKGIGQITDHISLCDRDLRTGNGKRARKDHFLNFQNPSTEGGTDNTIEVIMGDDLIVSF
jgi:hypothetical protein